MVVLEQRVGKGKRAMLDQPEEAEDPDRWDNRASKVCLAKWEKLELEDLPVSLVSVV